MSAALCSVSGCEKKARTRGWCSGHYERWLKHGDVRADVPLRRQVPSAATITCPRGHPLTEGNLVADPSGRGSRSCLICNRVKARNQAAAVKAACEALGLTRKVYIARFGQSHYTAEAVTTAISSGVPASQIIADAATYRAAAPGMGWWAS